MNLLEKLIAVFVCFAIAAAALIRIARLRQARIERRRRADLARASSLAAIQKAWRTEPDFVPSIAFNERMAEGLRSMRKVREWQGKPLELDEYEHGARIHRIVRDASGVPIECTPVVYGCPFDEDLDAAAERAVKRHQAERVALAEHLRTTPSVDEWLASRGDDEVTEVVR